MAITTTIAPSYGWRMLFIGVICVVFGVWGAYDYFYKIPHQERRFERYEYITGRLANLHEPRLALTADEQAEYRGLSMELDALAPKGKAPERPSKFNRMTQLVYISCILFAPYFFWLYFHTKKQVYQLDDQGQLHFANDKQHGTGQWPLNDIQQIDMDRWMAKSIAYCEHKDGRRLKLDAYLHKHLDLIVGSIASQLHPEQWTPDARPVKAKQPQEQSAAGESAL